MKRTVYIETTIPSSYFSTRSSARAIAWRESTRLWWEYERPHYELFTSVVVGSELRKSNFPARADAIELIRELPRLETVDEIADIVDVYVKNRLMPESDRSDAYHLAISSYYGVHFLLTWNSKHLANPRKVEHITIINNRLGLYVPRIVTPDELVHEE